MSEPHNAESEEEVYDPANKPEPPPQDAPQTNEEAFFGPGGLGPGGMGDEFLPVDLDFLATTETIQIREGYDFFEVFSGIEQTNRYTIYNEQEEQFMFAIEEGGCYNTCAKQLLRTYKPFRIAVYNMNGEMAVQCHRGLWCQGCCFPCCLNEMEIHYPPGNVIATVEEVWSMGNPKFKIVNNNGDTMFEILGHNTWCRCLNDSRLNIVRADGSGAGVMMKRFGGIEQIYGQSNNFCLTFDKEEDCLNKAILIGSVFLVDFMVFESKNDRCCCL